LGIHIGLEIRKWRRRPTWSHVCPENSAALGARIRRCSDFLLELALGRLAGHVDAGTGHIEFPPVIDAAQAVVLISSVEERRAAMGAGMRQQAYLAGGTAKRDEIFAEQTHAQRRSIARGELG